ncbi:MAG: hypothetical protein ACJAYF_004034 [Arenicella sp.]|jgi:hypothetical protein
MKNISRLLICLFACLSLSAYAADDTEKSAE